MIWLVSTILVAALIVFYVMAAMADAESGISGWLLRKLDNLHSELKAKKLVAEARRELAERRNSGRDRP